MGLNKIERLYYDDSFLVSFDAVVTDIQLVSRTGGEALWRLSLDRSAFYPTSGGQPFDKGILAATSRSGAVLEIPIDLVEEDEEGGVWHYTDKPLVAGTAVHATIDWDRRLDHMQQHSGQHLLSAIFARELGAHTLSFHLGEDSSTIDLNSASVARASLDRVERIVNQVIAGDRAFSRRTVARSEADALLAAGKVRKLPERDGDIRLVEIDGIDLNACGGTHVRSTGQIGGLALRTAEKVRGGLRIEFVCGLRAMTAARRDFSLLSEAAVALSVGRENLPPTIERLLGEAKHAAKERQKLRDEVARFEAAAMVGGNEFKNGSHIVRRIFAEHDAAYIKLLASKIAAEGSHAIALLASTQHEPASIVLACGKGSKFSCGALMKDALAEIGLRGGGSPSLAQGQVPRSALDALIGRLEAGVSRSREEAIPAKS